MPDEQKIQILHRILAVSGFICALLILPFSHYYLLDRQLTSVAETGQVAGVSTTLPEIAASPSASPLTCAQKAQKLADLDKWLVDQKTYEAQRLSDQITPFQKTLPTLTGQEYTALNSVITTAQQTSQARVQAAEGAVDSQKKDVASLPCAVE